MFASSHHVLVAYFMDKHSRLRKLGLKLDQVFTFAFKFGNLSIVGLKVSAKNRADFLQYSAFLVEDAGSLR